MSQEETKRVDANNVKIIRDEAKLHDIQFETPSHYSKINAYEMYIGYMDECDGWLSYFDSIAFSRKDALMILHEKFIQKKGYSFMYSRYINTRSSYKCMEVDHAVYRSNCMETEVKNVLSYFKNKYQMEFSMYERVVFVCDNDCA